MSPALHHLRVRLLAQFSQLELLGSGCVMLISVGMVEMMLESGLGVAFRAFMIGEFAALAVIIAASLSSGWGPPSGLRSRPHPTLPMSPLGRVLAEILAWSPAWLLGAALALALGGITGPDRFLLAAVSALPLVLLGYTAHPWGVLHRLGVGGAVVIFYGTASALGLFASPAWIVATSIVLCVPTIFLASGARPPELGWRVPPWPLRPTRRAHLAPERLIWRDAGRGALRATGQVLAWLGPPAIVLVLWSRLVAVDDVAPLGLRAVLSMLAAGFSFSVLVMASAAPLGLPFGLPALVNRSSGSGASLAGGFAQAWSRLPVRRGQAARALLITTAISASSVALSVLAASELSRWLFDSAGATLRHDLAAVALLCSFALGAPGVCSAIYLGHRALRGLAEGCALGSVGFIGCALLFTRSELTFGFTAAALFWVVGGLLCAVELLRTGDQPLLRE